MSVGSKPHLCAHYWDHQALGLPIPTPLPLPSFPLLPQGHHHPGLICDSLAFLEYLFHSQAWFRLVCLCLSFLVTFVFIYHVL